VSGPESCRSTGSGPDAERIAHFGKERYETLAPGSRAAACESAMRLRADLPSWGTLTHDPAVSSRPWISLVGCPFRAENRGWSLSADVDDCLTAEVVSKPGAGSRFAGRSVSLRARGLDFSTCAPGSCGQRPPDQGEEARLLTTTQDNEEIIERVAALDIGKAELMCCVRVALSEEWPGSGGRREVQQESAAAPPHPADPCRPLPTRRTAQTP